jgi:hypothetical protein
MDSDSIDPGIRRLVQSIAAIDDHAHPIPLEWEVPPDLERPVTPYDLTMPLRMRPHNPEYLDAWRALWAYQHNDFATAHLVEMIAAKLEAQAAHGDGYGAWVLDQVNIETMLAVDTELRPFHDGARFRWVPHVDWLLWPVPAIDQEPITGQYASLLQAACRRLGLDQSPTTVQEFVRSVLRPVITQNSADGAAALKFHTPYYRPIDFGEVPEVTAQELYQRSLTTGISSVEHRALEDYLFAEIALLAGELNLPIQMHTGQGPKVHFENKGSNPLLMEPAVVAAPRTKFLLLHAGWPFDREAVASLAHENVFLDISGSTVHLQARNLGGIVRGALEWFPEKVLYGTDAYSDTAHAFLSSTEPRSNFLHGWEEKAWLLDRTARDALTIALTGMLRDRVIRADDIERLATMVLRDNALRLYSRLGSRQ